MAYNFMNHHHFDYDYNDLKRAIRVSKVFTNENIVECFCDYWIEKLKAAEVSVTEELCLDMEINAKEEETYTLGGMINGFQYFLFFNVSRIIKAHEYKHLNEHKILLSDLVDCLQLGNQVNTDYYDEAKKDNPLIAIDLSYGDKLFTLIDGNHRFMNFLIPNNIEEARVVFLSNADKSIDFYFIDELSKVYYYFVKEWVMLMGNAKNLSDKDKIDLIEMKNDEKLQEIIGLTDTRKWWKFFRK